MLTGLFRKLFTRENRGRILTIIFSLFAFGYHLVFLLVFKKYRVTPMYYFNFLSVVVFLLLSVLSIFGKKHAVPFIAALIEVAFHQVLADYYIGLNTNFHYFIVATGLLTLLVLDKKIRFSFIYTVFSLILFLCLENILESHEPLYVLPKTTIENIKFVNTFLGLFIILCGVALSTFILNFIEDNLEYQVKEKTKELEGRNHRVYELQNHIISSLANLVENRDQDTGEHIQRTSHYVHLISQKAFEKNCYPETITEEFVDTIQKAAPMHDIGKIVVPDSILQKPGKLTTEEFAKMEKHTVEGKRIIHDIIGVSEDKYYVQMASDIAVSHHERWDGNGYPNKLKGEDIPISARIMAIADVFDALVSKRCYKEPMSLDKAFQIIQEDKEKHFDPLFADIFIENRKDVEKIFNKYNK